MTRTIRRKLIFRHAFQLAAVGHTLPAGEYELISDEEMIEGLSFPVYRRVSSWIMAPTKNSSGSIEMIAVDPKDIEAAQVHDHEMSKRQNH